MGSRFASTYDLARGGFKEEDILDFTKQAVAEGRSEKWAVSGEEHSDWNRRMLMYYGKDKINTNPFRQRVKENRIWPALEFQRGILYDHLPSPEFQARNFQKEADTADRINTMAKFIEDVSDYRQGGFGFFHNLLVFGTGIMKVFYDPTAHGGRGMVSFKPQDPRTMFVAPGAATLNDSPYVIASGMSDIDAALAMWPGKREELLAALQAGGTERGGGGILGTLSAYVLGNRGEPVDAGNRSMGTGDNRRVEILEIYVQVPKIAELAGVSEKGVKVKPGEWHVITLIGGKIVAKNEALPYKHGRLPFVAAQNRFRDGKPWGVSDTEVVESLQQELDRLSDKRSSWIERSFKPWIMYATGFGIRQDSFTTGSDFIPVPSIAALDAMKIIEMPSVNREARGRRDEIMREINEEIGSILIPSDVLQRNVAPTTLAQVRETNELPVRMKLKAMEPAFKEMWIQAVNLLQQYYPDDVIVRVLDGAGGEDEQKSVTLNEIKELKDIDETKYDMRLGMSASAPFSRAALFADMVAVINAGAFNPDLPMSARNSLLEASNWPNRSEIMKEQMAMAKKQEEEAKLAAEAAAAQPQVQAQQIPPSNSMPMESAVAPPPLPVDPLAALNELEDPGMMEQALAGLPEDQLMQLMASQGVMR